MADMIYQRRDRQALSTRISVNTPRHKGGKALEDNRAAFKVQQEAQLKKNGPDSGVDGNIEAAAVSADNAQVQLKAGVPINDDKSLEHEADTMGQKALQMRADINGANPAAESPDNMHGNSEAPSQLSSAGETAQLKESLQPEIAQREQAPAKPNNTGLPDNLKSGIEALSGMSMDNVKVHYNSSQPAQLNALAYAQGTDIHVAPGQEQHLPHEAWHVVQQAQGRVLPTMQMKVKNSAVLTVRAGTVAQLAPKYAKLINDANFSAKHLHANASQNLCSAMLVARKYRGWKSTTVKHSLISNAMYPAAWKVPNIGAGYKTSSSLDSISRQYIASDPNEVTAGSKWTVKSKTTAANPSVAGNVSALNPAENHSNGSGANPLCTWQMNVDHLVGAEDNGLNVTTVEWDAALSQYKVSRGNDNTDTFNQADVEQ